MAGKNTTLEVGALILPVKLEKISTRSDVKIDRATKDGNKIARSERDAVTGEVVEPDEIKYGVFENPREGTGFREIPKEALEAIEAETEIDTFAVEHFISLKELPLERSHAAYYLTPQKGGNAKSLKLLHEALKRSKKAGVFKLQLTKRQYLGALYAQNGGLMVNLLHFASDFKPAASAGEAFADAQVKPDQVALAAQLIEALSTDASVIDTFEDDLVALKQDLVDQALAGKKLTPKAKAPKKKAASDDLAKLLEASVEDAQRRKASSGKGKAERQVAPV